MKNILAQIKTATGNNKEKAWDLLEVVCLASGLNDQILSSQLSATMAVNEEAGKDFTFSQATKIIQAYYDPHSTAEKTDEQQNLALGLQHGGARPRAPFRPASQAGQNWSGTHTRFASQADDSDEIAFLKWKAAEANRAVDRARRGAHADRAPEVAAQADEEEWPEDDDEDFWDEEEWPEDEETEELGYMVSEERPKTPPPPPPPVDPEKVVEEVWAVAHTKVPSRGQVPDQIKAAEVKIDKINSKALAKQQKLEAKLAKLRQDAALFGSTSSSSQCLHRVDLEINSQDEAAEAKHLGARYDTSKKVWYLDPFTDIMPFVSFIAESTNIRLAEDLFNNNVDIAFSAQYDTIDTYIDSLNIPKGFKACHAPMDSGCTVHTMQTPDAFVTTHAPTIPSYGLRTISPIPRNSKGPHLSVR